MRRCGKPLPATVKQRPDKVISSSLDHLDNLPDVGAAAGAALVRLGTYVVLISTPSLLSAAFPSAGEDAHGFIQQLANTLALFGYSIVAMQFVLSARLKWIEWPFGLDILLRFHKSMGLFAGLLLLSHPVLMAWGGNEWPLVTRVSVAWPIQLGRVALLTLVAMIIVSLWRRTFRLAYEQWRVWHSLLALGVLALGFIHSVSIGMDLKEWAPRAVWGGYLAAALAAYTYHRSICPRRMRSWPHKVVGVEPETHNVYTIKLQREKDGPVFDYLPGQFYFITFHGEGLAAEEHPFTISSSPSQGTMLASTIKESGDFTATISRTQLGDRVAVRGPFGRFCYLLHQRESALVFIAAGVGITPLMSMLRYMRDSGEWKPVLLIYNNRTERDIIFRKEL